MYRRVSFVGTGAPVFYTYISDQAHTNANAPLDTFDHVTIDMNTPIMEIIGSTADITQDDIGQIKDSILSGLDNLATATAPSVNEINTDIDKNDLLGQIDNTENHISLNRHLLIYSLLMCVFSVMFYLSLTSIYQVYATQFYINSVGLTSMMWTSLVSIFVTFIPVLAGIDYAFDPEWYWSCITFTNYELVRARNRYIKQQIYNMAYQDIMSQIEIIDTQYEVGADAGVEADMDVEADGDGYEGDAEGANEYVSEDKEEKNVGTNIGTNAETQTNNENAENAQNTLSANIIEHSVKYEPVPEDKKNQ